MSRDIFTVIKQMIECIPKDNLSSQQFLNALNNHLYNLSFVPPEQMYDILQFNLVTKILIQYFGKTPPTEGWQKNVYDIWMDKK